MLLELDNAERYFLAPNDSEDILLIGNKNAMNYMASLMKKGDAVMSLGQTGAECIIVVSWNTEKCNAKIKEALELMSTKMPEVIDGVVED